MPATSLGRLHRNDAMPYYRQLSEMLRRKITNGDWQPGHLLPSESEISEEHAVSRITARQALDELAHEGLIFRQRGKGSFVAHQTVEQGLVRIISFTEDMRQRGFEPGTRLLFADLVPAPPDIAERLNISVGDELVRIDRLRLADGEPMSVEQAHFNHQYCPGLLQCDLVSESLRSQMDLKYGIRWGHAKQTIRAVTATRDLADLLAVKMRAALLQIERVSFMENETPVEFLRVYHRGDRYVLYSELRG